MGKERELFPLGKNNVCISFFHLLYLLAANGMQECINTNIIHFVSF